MLRRFQKGDVGTTMVVVMVVMMVGFFRPWGMGHDRRDGRTPEAPPTAEASSSASSLLDEKYVRGELSREEYLRKREDLLQPDRNDRR